MTQVRISELPTASGTLAGSEVFPAVQSGVDYKVSLTQAQNAMGIYAGTGSPTASADDGSIYLRNDGLAGSTLYARVSGSWTALGSGSSSATPRPTFAPLGINGWQAQVDEGWDTMFLTSALSASVKPSIIRFNFLQFHDYHSGAGTYTAEVLAIMKSACIGHTMTLFYGADPWDSDYVGFAEFARSAINWHTTNFPGVLKAVEIWNEGDGGWPVNTTQYLGMTRAIYSAVSTLTAYSTFPLIGPVISAPFSTGYLEPWLVTGVQDFLDVMSYHSYQGPEYLIFDHHNFLTEVGSSKPVYISEWDYDTANAQKISRRLTIMKYLGVWAASYFPVVTLSPTFQGIIADFSGSKSDATDNWIAWNDKIGNSATFVSRDSINSNAFSFLFNDAAGLPIRHIWAMEPTRVLINSASALLSEYPIYVSGTATVALDPTADVLLAHTQWNWATSASATGAPWYFTWERLSDSASGAMSPESPWQWSSDGSLPDVFNIGYHGSYPNYRGVRTWIASATGTIRLAGYSYRAATGGDGTSWRFRHNTSIIFERTADTTQVEHDFWLVRSVVPTDTIRFEVEGLSAADGTGTTDDADKVVIVAGIYQTNRTPTDFINIRRDIGTIQGFPFRYIARTSASMTETDAIWSNSGQWLYSSGSAALAESNWNIRTRSAGIAVMKPGSALHAMTRWTAPVQTTVRISGSMFTSGTSVDVMIYKNASSSFTLLYSNIPLTSGSATATFDLTATVAGGHSIEFEVGAHSAASATPVYFTSAFISRAVS